MILIFNSKQLYYSRDFYFNFKFKKNLIRFFQVHIINIIFLLFIIFILTG